MAVLLAVQGRFQAAAVTLDLRDDANFSRPCSSRTFPGIVGDDPPDEQSIASTLKRNAAEDFSGIYRDLLELLDARTDSGNRSLGIVH